MVQVFSIIKSGFLEKRGSDHRHVLVRLMASVETYQGNFRFDRRFLNKPNVKEAILQAWNESQSEVVASVSNWLGG